MQAGRFDFEVICLDRFGVLPEAGALNDQDPAFVDEVRIFLSADAAHQKKINKKT